jgi:hypothetical protein
MMKTVALFSFPSADPGYAAASGHLGVEFRGGDPERGAKQRIETAIFESTAHVCRE